DAADVRVHRSARLLNDLLRDPSGLTFAVGFVDRVVRPEDPDIAAAALRDLAGTAPRFVPWYLRGALRAGALGSRLAPRLVVAVARRALRHMVGHLLIDASGRRLTRALAGLRRRGVRPNVNLLGEAVLGAAEAQR